MSDITRRDFLKASGAIVAGSILGANEPLTKLAEAGYTNLRFLDATARKPGDDPSYNYVFFGDDVMPKIVDKKKDGGVIGMGLGSV